ncbi:MAG TPA: hypothetical protein VHX16_02545 [Chloroflexota bacterium]|nr:hypothetical protein [Chloroflexota bacterium]
MTGWQGEIVESRSTELVAQSYDHRLAPPFGSLLCSTVAEGLSIYGVVYEVATTGIDPGARPVVRGHAGLRDQAIYDANPDLSQVLRTDVSALLVGFHEGSVLRQVLPPTPPPLHWTVFECEADACREFGADTAYLRSLVDAAQVPADELIGAHVRLMHSYAGPGDAYLMRAGRELAELLRSDYPRLRSIIDRVRPRASQVSRL